ncbi:MULTISPECIES: tetratricopeptide repeat protein [unclassified Streptomyces]|uniref:tetratricopeptide repeat protein n=1 Tax=unclassified Streptomyces TaxID=2593676 RepID=UPI003D8C3B17
MTGAHNVHWDSAAAVLRHLSGFEDRRCSRVVRIAEADQNVSDGLVATVGDVDVPPVVPLQLDVQGVTGSPVPSRTNLAVSLRGAGRAQDAIALEEHILADYQRVLGSVHPQTLTARANLAASYLESGRVEEAVAVGEHILADYQRVLGSVHPQTLHARTNLAASYLESGRVAEAIALGEHVAADHDRLLGLDHADTFRARANLSASYRRAGRTTEAEAVEERLAPDRDELSLGLYIGRVAGNTGGRWITRRKT